MTRTATSPCDVAEHLRTAEDMAAYLEADRRRRTPPESANNPRNCDRVAVLQWC